MREPFPLFVDELSPDKIKATVLDPNSFFYNLTILKLLGPRLAPVSIGKITNGVSIVPMGRFICMLAGYTGNRSMILLDLIDKEELAGKIAETLSQTGLRDRFMQVYGEIISHPENHRKCKLVLGRQKDPFRAISGRFE